MALKRHSVLPGFGITMGFTLLYLSLIILIPLSALIFSAAKMTWPDFWHTVSASRAVASYKLTFGASLAAALINAVFGFIVAWVLVRYKFPGRKFLDALVDLPFAMPTAVSGIALTAIYSQNGWIGRWLEPLGIKVAFTPLGIIVALTFIGLPFVVRTLQPALQDIDVEIEEASVSLGASKRQTFTRVILPGILPALLTGFAMAFARAIGEYGSIVFISANIPLKTEITPFLIVAKLEEYDYAGATALGLVMLVASFAMLLVINYLQWQSSHKYREAAI